MSFDPISYAMGKQAGGGGGGVTVEPLSVTANGVYNAPTGKAYSPVTVNVGTSVETDMTNATFTDTNTDGNVVITEKEG